MDKVAYGVINIAYTVYSNPFNASFFWRLDNGTESESYFDTIEEAIGNIEGTYS